MPLEDSSINFYCVTWQYINRNTNWLLRCYIRVLSFRTDSMGLSTYFALLVCSDDIRRLTQSSWADLWDSSGCYHDDGGEV